MSADKIEESTKAGQLIPPSELANLVTALPDKARAIQVLQGQVDLATQSKRKKWRKELARELDKLQFHSQSWICQNIHELPAAKKIQWQEEPSGTSKDIRLKTDPSVQMVRADCGTKASSSPEPESLLEGVDMEVDVGMVDETKLLASPKKVRASPKPVSPVKPFMKEDSPKKSWAETMELEDPLLPPSSSSSSGAVATANPSSSGKVAKTSSQTPRSYANVVTSGMRRDQPNLVDRKQDSLRDKYARCPGKGKEKVYPSPYRSRDLERGRRGNRPQSGQKQRYIDPVTKAEKSGSHQDRRRPTAPVRDHSSTPKEKCPKMTSSSQRLSRCPVPSCHCEFTQKHALEAHLPGIFWLCVPGESITNRRIGALKLVVRWLLGFNSTLLDLVVYLETVGIPVFQETCSDELKTAAREFCEALRVPMPEDLSPRRRGNAVTVLLQWRCLLTLISMLEAHQVDSLKVMFQLSSDEKEFLPSLPRAFDSHCHLDRTMRELNLSDSSLAAICAARPQEKGYEVNVVGATAICCDPDTYPSNIQIKSWVDQGVVVVCGIHPKLLVTDERLGRLAKLLDNSNVIGLGEVGIDRTLPTEKWAEQLWGLERVLNLLKPEQILVLHARSGLDVGDEAILSLMYQLASHPRVRKEQLIHLHCYTGTKTVMDRWLEQFPNTYFGFTSVVRLFNTSNIDQMAAVCNISANRMLLETDAPYFAPVGMKRSTPGLIGSTAASVAKVTRRDWKEVLQKATANAERLYLSRKAPASD